MRLKRFTSLCLIVVVLFLTAFVLWRARLYSTPLFLRGNSISLLDHLRPEFIINSKMQHSTERLNKLHLKNGWRKIAVFPSASVWATVIDADIVKDGRDNIHLYNGPTILRFDSNLFRPGIVPERWNYYRNQIFISIEKNATPQQASYFLDSEAFASLHPAIIHREPLKPLAGSLPIKIRRDAKFTFYELLHPILLQTMEPVAPQISLLRDGKKVPISEWYWVSDFETPIYESDSRAPLNLTGPKVDFEKDIYVKYAPFDLLVVARASLAGAELPRLGVFVDGQKVESIPIRSARDEPYATNLLLGEGVHKIKLLLENDYFNPQTLEDRNIVISKCAIHYKSAIAVAGGAGGQLHRYEANYASFGTNAAENYSELLRSSKTSVSVNGVRGAITLGSDLRQSLIAAFGDVFEFQIAVPENASLNFGYGSYAQSAACTARFSVVVKTAFHFPITLFSKTPASAWQDAQIDLKRFAGKNVRLSFQTAGQNSSDSCPALTFISNPAIESTNPNPASLPHLIVISFDALRADHLGVYGYQRRISPNIDRFAGDAVLFENAMSAATWTLPSFQSLFTSLYPAFHNVTQANRSLDPSIVTMPQLFKSNRYHTAAFVDNPFLHPLYGFAAGFESYDYQLADINARAEAPLRWLQAHGKEQHFLFVHLISPHSPYAAPASFARQLANRPGFQVDPLFYSKFDRAGNHCAKLTSMELEESRLLYDAEILELDQIFQHFIDKLKQLEIYDDALIILMSDHGEEFWEHGNLTHGRDVYQETARVPLLIKFPKHYLHGINKRIQSPVQLIDVLPTLLEMLKMKFPQTIQGRSLLPLIVNDDAKAFKERTFYVESGNQKTAILRGRYKYIFSRVLPSPRSCAQTRAEELYDLQEDPDEKRDLIEMLPQIARLFREDRLKYEERAIAFRNQRRKASRDVSPDPAMQEQMRALGYLQ